MTSTTKSEATAFPRNSWINQLTTTTNLQVSFWRGAGTADYADNHKVWQVINFGTKPDTPSVSSVTEESRNPVINSSAFSGFGTHDKSSWKIVTTANCTSGSTVWESFNNGNQKTSITVNNTQGTFVNTLSGETQLGKDTTYYACVAYINGAGVSDWSNNFSFTTNMKPDASNANMESGAASINLTSGTTKSITGTVDVTDEDSCQDIDTVNARFYRTSLGYAGSADNNNRYIITCTVQAGTCTGAEDTTASYNCNYDIQYYAEGTDPASQNSADDWSYEARPVDEVGEGDYSIDTTEINSLVSIATTSFIDFGLLQLGTNTGSTNQIIEVTNIGNTRVDILLSAYAVTEQDGNSLSCSYGVIPITNLKYNLLGFTYDTGGTAVSSSPVEIDFDLEKSTGSTSKSNVYFGLQIPIVSVSNNCTGTVVINGVNDSLLD